MSKTKTAVADQYAKNSRQALEEIFESAWNTLMAQAKNHTTPAQHRQWRKDAKRFINERVAGLQWQDAAYSGNPRRMNALRTQRLFELTPE